MSNFAGAPTASQPGWTTINVPSSSVPGPPPGAPGSSTYVRGQPIGNQGGTTRPNVGGNFQGFGRAVNVLSLPGSINYLGRELGNGFASAYILGENLLNNGSRGFNAWGNSQAYLYHGTTAAGSRNRRELGELLAEREPWPIAPDIRAGELVPAVGQVAGGLYRIDLEVTQHGASQQWYDRTKQVKGEIGDFRWYEADQFSTNYQVFARTTNQTATSPRKWVTVASASTSLVQQYGVPQIRNLEITLLSGETEPVTEQPRDPNQNQVVSAGIGTQAVGLSLAATAAIAEARAQARAAQQTAATELAVSDAKQEVLDLVDQKASDLTESVGDQLAEAIPCDICTITTDIGTNVTNVSDTVNDNSQKIGEAIQILNDGFQDVALADIWQKVTRTDQELQTPITITQQVHQCAAEEGEEAPPPAEPKTVTAKPFQAMAQAFGHNAEVTNKAHEEVCGLEFEPELTVPQDWETRASSNRPQLVIVWREKASDGSLGRRWQTVVPHYVHEEGWMPPEWRKGSSWCRARLKDNSHIIVYAHNQSAARAVVEALLARVNDEQKPASLGTGDILSGEFEEVDVVPYLSDYYANGRSNGKPESRFYYQ